MKDSLLDVAKRTDAFFMEKSPIHEAMRKLSSTLKDMNLSFAIAGAMAANMHGHGRTTADVNILIGRDALKRFKTEWIGRGWVDKFEGSKGFRDTLNNVDIDVLIVGEFPGDGLPKPVAFPEPDSIAVVSDEIPYVSLKTLIELKLASGMTAEHRIKDMADVIELVRVNELSRSYADELDPYVRAKYQAMWRAAQVDEDYLRHRPTADPLSTTGRSPSPPANARIGLITRCFSASQCPAFRKMMLRVVSSRCSLPKNLISEPRCGIG